MDRLNPGTRTDEELIQSVASGNLDAFNEIVLRYESLAWKTACRFLGDSMEAQDVAQEAFLKIFEGASRYRAKGAFRTYFYRTLTHLCIDRRRKKHPTSIDDIPEVPDSSPDPTQTLIEKERGSQIREALDSLPLRQKTAMILRHYEGLSYAEIAQVLGTTPKAVDGLISRASAWLSALLDPL